MNAMIYKKKGPLVLFLVPTFLFLTMYLYYPFLMNIYNSLNKIGGLGESSRGLNEPVWENYVKMFTDPLMRTALKNTMILMILTVVFQVVKSSCSPTAALPTWPTASAVSWRRIRRCP